MAGMRTALPARDSSGLNSWNRKTAATAIHTGRQCGSSTTL